MRKIFLTGIVMAVLALVAFMPSTPQPQVAEAQSNVCGEETEPAAITIELETLRPTRKITRNESGNQFQLRGTPGDVLRGDANFEANLFSQFERTFMLEKFDDSCNGCQAVLDGALVANVNGVTDFSNEPRGGILITQVEGSFSSRHAEYVLFERETKTITLPPQQVNDDDQVLDLGRISDLLGSDFAGNSNPPTLQTARIIASGKIKIGAGNIDSGVIEVNELEMNQNLFICKNSLGAAGNAGICDFQECAEPQDDPPPPPQTLPQCDDGQDNDGDGRTDFPGDSGCDSATDDDETSPQCDDTRDNDGDGVSDFPADPGCDSPLDDDETNPPIDRNISFNVGGEVIDFPPYQEFPVFMEDTIIAFDENGASVRTATAPPPISEADPRCSDGLDNDSDGVIDFPDDPGCDSAEDQDETDPPGPEELQLNIPSEFVTTIIRADLSTDLFVVLPNAQEQFRYQFQLTAEGGDGPLSFGVNGRNANAEGNFTLDSSGLVLQPDGLVTGASAELRAGNYRYQFFVTDGEQTLPFTAQIAVFDVNGNPVSLEIQTNITGSELGCQTNKVCEAFFKADNGIPPYSYSLTGETPPGGDQLLEINEGESFFSFIPTADQVGSFNMTITAFDSANRIETGEEAGNISGATTTLDFTLVIELEEIETTFRFSAPERSCEFLDLSPVDDQFPFFQFTCRNGIMEGSQGNVRARETLNRAEAAKITTLIETSDEIVKSTFQPFERLEPRQPVNYQDVLVQDWFAEFVYYLFTQGIIIDNDLYRPADTLTNAEAMKLVVEAYLAQSEQLFNDLEDITNYTDWFQPYQTIASYVDAEIAFLNPGAPAQRGHIAELVFKLHQAYYSPKFK